jgi:RHS repeat-associated protein
MKTITAMPSHKSWVFLFALVSLFFSLGQASAGVFTNYLYRPIEACGRETGIALKPDGTVWTWTEFDDIVLDGQQGQRAGNAYDTEDYILTEPSMLTEVLGGVSVAAGDDFSLVLKWNGTVVSFGGNNYGQLGTGNTTGTSQANLVTNLSSVSYIAAGSFFSEAVLSNGTVRAWGVNLHGELGIGSTTPNQLDVPTNVLGLSNILMVACGYNHVLALDKNGHVWAWGDNSDGELGDGTTTVRYLPVLTTNLSGIASISAGYECSYAITTNGAVYAWGDNSDGQLGLGLSSLTYSNKPAMIPNFTNICQINSASDMTYAVDTSGRLWGWGNDWPYALGAIPSSVNKVYSPVQQTGLPNISYMGSFAPKAQSSSLVFMSALDINGIMRAWGYGYKEQTGGVVDGGNAFDGADTTNMDWGYNNFYTETNVEPNAYYRGSSSEADFTSFVMPLNLQAGTNFASIGGAATNLLPFVTNYPVGYQYNAANSGAAGQTNLSLRVEYQNPIVGFGSRVGGSTLYTGRSYNFAIFSGCPAMINDYPMLTNYDSALEIEVYAKSNYSLITVTNLPIPFYLATNGSWAVFLTNGLTTSLSAYGLTTTLSTLAYPSAYGVTNNGALQLSQMALGVATNYIYVVKFKGMNGNGWMSLDQNGNPAWQPLYTLEFSPAPPWNIQFLSQIQFQNEPLPPFYYGQSVDELLTNSWTVTNVINVPDPITSYTNIDDSPELRESPILDNFVTQLKNDPLAIARYVQNQIQLTDAIDYLGNSEITAGQLNLAGVNRSALGVFLEGQGSPVEQCSLLIYLLRKAGVPAVYALPPTNGIKMADMRLSNMLRAQLNNALDPYTGAVNTNSVISVNYPWVAAYINGKWVNLFPWIKDTEIIQGPNLYDYMPTNYNNVMKWVMGYLYNRPEIVGLGDTNDPPETLFPRYVENQLLTNAPGVSFDQLGVQAVDRQHVYPTWSDFPTPTWVANTNWVAESLSDPTITNSSFQTWNPYIFPANHVFNTMDIQVIHNSTNMLDSGTVRCCDLHDRTFLIYAQRTNQTSGLEMEMNLAAYRPAITNITAFTNDASLLNNQVQSQILPFSTNYTNNLSISVTENSYRTTGSPDTISRSMPIAIGDLNALCLNFGRVTQSMLQPLAQNVWNVENEIQQTPSITNSLTVSQYQGPLIYLMGMSYYQKVDHFIPIDAQINGRSPVTDIGIGLAKLICKKSSGALPAGAIIYNQPCVDMAYNQRIMAEAPTAQPATGTEIDLANDNFNLLTIVDGSAKEHVTINEFFQQSDAVSTVRLLQLTNQRYKSNPTNYEEMLVVNENNAISIQEDPCIWAIGYNEDLNARGVSPSPYPMGSPGVMDPSIWNTVLTAILDSPQSQAFVTYGNTTNNTGSYLGSAALIIDNQNGVYSALIGGNANGGFGDDIPDYSFENDNLANVWLNTDGDGNYSVDFTAPSLSFEPLASDDFSPDQTFNLFDDANSGFLQYTPFNNQWASQSAGYLGSGSTGGSLNSVFANDLLSSQNQGFLGWLSDGLGQLMSAVKDPVHVVTGEFYVDTIDLTLVGPLPLEIRRNYSSLNLADNEFGIGWKMSFTPYISIATNGAEMYAAEPDGSVLAYTASPTNANLWLPTVAQNPQLVNNRKQGIGSTANLFLSKIVETNQSGSTNFYLYSPNGDTRIYQERSYLVYSTSNVIDRTRPYLTTWLDARGNSLVFTIGTNSQDTDFGQLSRVDSSSGAYIQFTYDVDGHILTALANDGREVDYQYDDYGDLVTVTLPDASQINYAYVHGYQPVTNSYTANSNKYTNVIDQVYSLHLLNSKTDPDGRILENTYDSQRRVLTQVATVGPDGGLMTNATFVYSNNFVLTNFVTNTISGYTKLADVFGNVTTYNYTNSRITLITDPLSQTVEQDWYDENTNLTGYYPRSVWRTKDKRGLWTYFQYDSFGNITNMYTSGNLTGQGGTQTATNITYYNSNNLPVLSIDAIGNSNVFQYDPDFNFLPKQLVSYRQGQAITTNLIVYGSYTNVVLLGNTLWTNVSFGLPQFLVRAYDSPDAATNQWFYNGSGFATNEVDFTSTTDPAITNQLFYDGRGELCQLIDAAGRTYTYDYDGLGRVITEQAFESGQTTPMSWQDFYYDHNGDITWYDGPQYNPEDYVWYDYDGAGRKVSEVHWRSQASPDGSGVIAAPASSLYSITSYIYDGFGNLIQQTDPVGNYSIMAYDKIGQMTNQVFYDANNNALATNTMSHEPGGQIANFTNSLGGVSQTLYTQTGKPYFRQNPDGSTNGWQYDLLGRVQDEFLPNGSYWQTTYQDANRTIIRQFFNTNGAVLAVTTNVYDRRGNVITNVTAEGGVFFNAYDGLNRIKVTGGPAASGSSAQQINYTYYDDAGVSVTNVDSVGSETVVTYDATERPLSSQIYDLNNGGALVDSQTTSYSADSHSVTVTAGSGGDAITKTTFLDSYYNPVLTQAYPNSITTNFTITSYDLDERVASSQDEVERITSFTYDGLGRVKTKQLPDGATVVNSYNGEGGLTGMAMPGGLTWSATYNSANQRVSEQLASGASIERQFTNVFYASGPLAGLLQSATDLGRSVTTTFAYDGFRRVATSSATGPQPAQALATTYQYDSGGLVTNYTQTSGVNPTTSVNRFYDGYNQLTNEQIYINGVLQSSFAQNWDAAGHRSMLQAPTAQFDYTHRVDGLMSGITTFGNTYGFIYTNNGLLVGRSNPWRTLAVNSRDGQGRLTQQTDIVGSGDPLVETLAWLPDSTLGAYTATRSGTESWNDSRNYQYNLRGQLTSESLGVNSSVLATNNYSFDSSLLGVLVGAQWSGGLTNTWQGSLDTFSQVTPQSWNEASLTLRADGSAENVGSLSANLDASPVSSTLNDGRWYSDLTLSPGTHSLSASAYYPAGEFTLGVTNTFSVLGTNNVTDAYDLAGNVTNRVFASGKTQSLTWDASGRLVGLTQWNNPTNGFFWTAIYDALGRRLRTMEVPVVNGYTNTAGTLTLDAYFDPEVEFEEVGVGINGQRTWKVLGPDLDGQYGSLQGVGGLEATVRESDGLTIPVINDYLGNVLATISGTSTTWNPVRVDGYGPALGYQASPLTAGTPLADTLVWRSRGIDPSGFYNLGARYYDPLAGHFLSADPLGHAGSMDLQSFCNGDPVNNFDPTGRFGKGDFEQGFNDLGNAGQDLKTSYVDARQDALELDVAYGDQIQETFKAVDLAAVAFAVPVVGEGLLGEGLGVEGLGLEEGELGGIEGFNARSASWAESLEETADEEAEIGAANASKIANTFNESGQGEFGFAKEVEAEKGVVATEQGVSTGTTVSSGALSESVGGAETAEQLELPLSEARAASESGGGALQGEQLELNLGADGNGTVAEGTESDTVRETYKALGIETSSMSTVPSRVYSIYQQDGNLFKFGVTDVNFVRMNQSLEMAGPGSYARYTDVMPKYQAHLGEKYLRSLQYNSTGVWPLPGMKVPYPIDFTTKLPVSPQ